MNVSRTPADLREDSAQVVPTSVVAPEREDVARWRQFNAAHEKIQGDLTKALATVKLSVVEFTVLDVIHEQINGHLRMQDVAQVAGLTTGAATRLVNRLEDRGLLQRVLCSFDRRGIFSELTDPGREILSRARPLHDGALRQSLQDESTTAAIGTFTSHLPRH